VGDAEAITVVADEERFSAVMAHLIGNAQDASREGGKIEVRLQARGSEAVIEIVDNGEGMAPEFVRDRLFKPFQTTKQGGYGIGAFESRAYVQELGGRLDVISERGRGTTVRISLAMVNRTAPAMAQVASAL
jgi:signal transduction histidine kinase